jgi:ELWxxDGT repeat protein
MQCVRALVVVLACFVLAPGLAVADGPARLLKDINSVPSDDRGSYPGGFGRLGNITLFRARTHTLGFELWKSDGTEAGTTLVKDLNPGRSSGLEWTSGTPRSPFVEVNGVLLFPGTDGVHGYELWRSDGTAAGTFMLRDILPGSSGGLITFLGYDPNTLIWVNKVSGGLMYFLADDGEHGFELWRTDGTTAGTFLLQDIEPGRDSAFGSGEHYFLDGATLGSILYFRAANDATGGEFWRTDGTSAGTSMIEDILPGPGSGGPFKVTELNGQLLFVAAGRQSDYELWRSDGTALGTALVKDITPGFAGTTIQSLARAGNLVYFLASQYLYRTDGTASGTFLVHTFYSGGMQFVGDLGGRMLLRGDDAAHGTEPWISDGTPGGTFMLKDITPAGVNAWFQEIVRTGGVEYFLADDGVHGQEIWRTDGTPAGTRFVGDLTPGAASTLVWSSIPWQGGALFSTMNGIGRLDPGTEELTRVAMTYSTADLVALQGRALFSNDDGVHGQELWSTDGTEEGTGLLKDIEALPRTNSSHPGHLGTAIASDGKARALYQVYDGAGGGVWATDGTPRGTTRVAAIDTFSNVGAPGATLGDIVYFAADDGVHGRELWRSDGTAAGTRMVVDIGPEWGAVVSGPVAYRDRVYFVAEDAEHGAELWSSDGTEAGTHLVRDIVPGQESPYLDRLVSTGDALFFTAFDDHGRELWASDGTEVGTHLVKDIGQGSGGSCCRSMTPFNGRLFFEASDGLHGNEPWVSDGTEGGTFLLADIVAGGSSSFSREVSVAGPLAFFSVNDGVHGLELWRTDGTVEGTVLIEDFIPGIDDGLPSFLGPIGDSLVFLTRTLPQQGWEMWKSDGSDAGTIRLGAAFAGDAWAAASIDDALLFTEVDDAHGLELWRTDGREGGTAFVQDVAPGPDWSDPRNFVRLGTRTLFVADDPTANRELFAGRTSILLGRADLAVQDLGEALKELGLPRGIETSLLAKLSPATSALGSGRNVAAIVAIENFARHVEAQVPQHLAAEEAADLLEFAGDVVTLLKASSAPAQHPSKPGGPRPVPETD